MSWILNRLLKRVTFRLYNSNKASGRRLGGHNIPDVTDSYIILELILSGSIAFTGYFQAS